MSTGSGLKRCYRLTADIVCFRSSPAWSDDGVDVLFKGSFPAELLELFCQRGVEVDGCAFERRATDPCAAKGAVGLKGDPCVIEFECGPFDCATVLSKEPRIVVEMLSRYLPCDVLMFHVVDVDAVMRENGHETMIGIASVSLAQLMTSEGIEQWASIFRMGHNATQSRPQQNTEIGQILIKIKLEDKGMQHSETQRALKTQPCSPVAPEEQDTTTTSGPRCKENVNFLQEVGFENWKQRETEKHTRRLNQLEEDRMQILEEEWRRHEHLREKEINDLKTKLHDRTQQALTALKDTEDRERKVIVLQESLVRRRKDLERQHAAKLQETEDAINRLQKDFEHHLSLEKERTSEITSKNVQLKHQLKANQERTEQLETEIAKLKRSNAQTTVLMLQQELDAFKKLHAAAQDRVSVLEGEKNRYKARVVELAQQIGKLQAAHLPEERKSDSGVSGNESTQYHHADLETKTAQPSAEEFDTLKKELEALRIRTRLQQTPGEAIATANLEKTTAPCETSEVQWPNRQSSREEEICTILSNKRELLDTGVYNEDDELIRELDERIQHLKHSM